MLPQSVVDNNISSLNINEDNSNNGDSDGSNGRILAVLNKNAKFTKYGDDQTNSTIGEMEMNIFMLFEWKSGWCIYLF